MFTQSQFESYIRIVTSNPTYTIPADKVGLFSYYDDMYTEQLQELDLFNFTNVVQTREYRIPYCELTYLPIPLFQNTPALVVEKQTIGSDTSLVLNQGKDYTLEKINLNIKSYTLALNFKCLSCNCECEVIKVTGVYGIDMPRYLQNAIMNIIYNNLQPTSSTTIGGNDCCANIKSKSDGAGYSVTYYDKASSSTLIKDKDYILSNVPVAM